MRLLVVKLSAIGDVVHTLPAVSLLRASLPDAHIGWVVERRASAILAGSPVIDSLIELDTRGWRKALHRGDTRAAIASALGIIRSRFDIAIDFQGLLKSGLVTALSKAPTRIGFETRELREPASRVFLTEQVSTASLSHVIEKNLALAKAALNSVGVASLPNGFRFPIHIDEPDQQYARQIQERIGRPYAILNPGGGWPTKLWRDRNFAELADLLWERYGVASIITYGPGEEQLAQSVIAFVKESPALLVPSTLKQFVALARGAALFVGGDTGPLHLAAAAGTPVVGLYGPTLSQRNGPFHAAGVTLERDLWCRTACHRRACWHWQCMKIDVEEVSRVIAARLSRDEKNDQAR